MAAKEPQPPFAEQGLEPPGLEARMDPAPRYAARAYCAAGKLYGKRALITGGDSGIGRAVAWLYAREGADVAIVYTPEEEEDAREIAQQIESLSRRCLCLPGDLRDPAFCQQVVERTVQTLGGLDILVNNAAYQCHQPDLDAVSPDQWERTFRTNIDAYYHLSRAALPHLKAGGAIINTGSITGLEGNKGLLDYSATKGAIHAFTKSLAQNLVERGIRVNCVAPGPVWTPLNPAERAEGDIEDFGEGTPLGRPAQPEEVAPAYVFFASEADSRYISGHVLPLLGGGTTAA